MMLIFKQGDILNRKDRFIKKHSRKIVPPNVDSLLYLSTTGISTEEALFNYKLNRQKRNIKKWEELLLRFCYIKLQSRNIETSVDMNYPYEIKVRKIIR